MSPLQGITVTTTDHETGDTETSPLLPDNYVIVCGAGLYVEGEVVHSNGTRIITLKRNPAAK